MPPRIPNPEIKLPKLRVPKRGGAKSKAPEPPPPPDAPAELADPPEAAAALPETPEATAESSLAAETASRPRRGFLSAPKLSAPKLSAPKLRRSKRGSKRGAEPGDITPDAVPAAGVVVDGGLPASDAATPAAVAAANPATLEAPAAVGAPKRGRRSLGGPSLSLPKLAIPKLGGGSKPAAAKNPQSSKSFRRSRSERDVVGLDIEPGYVVAVQASANGSVKVTRAVGAPLDLDVVRDGEVLDPAALGHALGELFRSSGMGRTVRVGLANQRTVLRTLDLPPIDDRKQLEAAVQFQAVEEVPMPLNNAVLDFQALGIVDTPEGQRQRVVLVAAQRDMVERLLEALRIAGLRPVGVDLSAFALIRSLYERGGERGPNLVYLGVGGLTNMAVADGVTCKFTRVLGGGLESMAEALASRREIPVTKARELLFSVGLGEATDDAAALGPPPAAAPTGQEAYEYAPPPEAHEAYEYPPQPGGHEEYEYPAEAAAYDEAAGAYESEYVDGDAAPSHETHDPYAAGPEGHVAGEEAYPPASDAYPAEETYSAEADPYAAGAEGYPAEADPYAAGAEGHSAEADRYAAGAEGYPAEADRYAAGAEGHSAEADPYAAGAEGYPAEADPYAAGAEGHSAEADPYAAGEEGYPAEADPYAAGAEGHSAEADPYAAGAEGYPAAGDPYAAGEEGYPAEADPYAAGEEGHPTAGGPYAADEAGYADPTDAHGHADDPYAASHGGDAEATAADDDPHAGDDEVRFHTFAAGEDAGDEPADPGADPSAAFAGDPALHDVPADDDYATGGVYAAPAEDDPHEAVTREQPAYEDYEEPAPFTDDYVLEEAAPLAPLSPPPPLAAATTPTRSWEPDQDDDVHSVLSDGVREIAGEVRNSLDFQRVQGGGEPVQGIVLSGPVLDVPGFAEALERELGLPVYRGEVHADPGAMSGAVTSSRLAVAAGLAIEEVAP